MSTAAVIVAAGRGTRVGGDMPKQWRMLRGRVVAAWTLDAFLNSPCIDRIVLVLHADDMDLAPGYEGHDKVSV
ncbi:MAG: 2-C-methyl-D-erythritol 4-phosphate cytidylyltransferase, partial [Paracoccaceae bacterium]